MHIGGIAGGAIRRCGALRRKITRTPAFGLAVITPLVFLGAVGGASPRHALPVRDTAVTPLAAVAPRPSPATGPSVVAAPRPPTGFHVAAGATSAPPPPAIVMNTPGTLGIPTMALNAYRNAEQQMAASAPGCGVSWNLLAGIGRIESMHANSGATDARGTAIQPIYGPALDGTLPGNEVIVQSTSRGRAVYARAMGPMQFLPGTWARYASDGDGDGQADPQNIYDATLAAARYLCTGGLNLRDQSQVLTAILRYNNSMAYARNVLGWAAAYTTGVVPLDLPPITGPPPPIGDIHLEHPEGLGPSLPFNYNGLSPTDPLARVPLIDLGQGTGSPLPTRPGQPLHAAPCSVICIEPQAPAPAAPPAAENPGAPQPPMPPYAVPPADAAPAPVPPDPAVPPADLAPAPMPPYAVPPAN